MTNASLSQLSHRLRCKAVLLLTDDIDFAHDLLMASYMLDDWRHTRIAVDAMLTECTAVAALPHGRDGV
jgi:hypothetical protein